MTLAIDEFLTRDRPMPIGEGERARVTAALPAHGAIRPHAHDLATWIRRGLLVSAQFETASLVRVRTGDNDLRRAIAEGTRRSQTFRTLIDAVEHSHGFVYIVRAPYLPNKMEGCVVLGTVAAGENHFLRMMVKSGLGHDRTIVVVGHETQHVLEILERLAAGRGPEQSDLSWATQVSTREYETQTALDMEKRIGAELRYNTPGMATRPFTEILTSPGPAGAADKDTLAAAVTPLPHAPSRIAILDVAPNRMKVESD